MRILLVTARYLPHTGGLETVVHNLARQLDRDGHEIVIVTHRYPYSLPAKEVIQEIPVKRILFLYPQGRFLREKRMGLFLASCWFVWWSTWRLWRVIRGCDPDVVNLHYVGAPAPFLLLLKAILRFPWVVSLHGGDVDGEPYRSRFRAWLFRRVLNSADSITACSRSLAKQATELIPTSIPDIQVIHNGVDWERFALAKSYERPRPYIVAVGQLVPHKGFDLLINAFADISSEFPKVDLLIIGDGESRDHLSNLIQKRNLTERVHLLGRLDNETVASLMASSLFVAVPSRRESFGIVGLEGMAAGKPILATPVGGLLEFLPSDNNRMVKPTQSAWAKALSACLAADSGELDGSANQRCARHFTWDQVAKRYLEEYRRVKSLGR